MNTILYEAPSSFSLEFLIIPAIMLIFIVLFPIIMKKSAEEKGTPIPREGLILMNVFLACGALFILFLSAIAFIFQYNMYNKTVGAYYSGEYQTVEGYVENFHPMPSDGKSKETFDINGVEFAYSDYNIHPGYNKSQYHGGVITGNGQHLKIRYVYFNETYGNIILYIEEIPE